VTVFGSGFTPDGRYLACSDNFGQVGIWNMEYYLFQNSNWVHDNETKTEALETISTNSNLGAGVEKDFLLKAHKTPIYSIAVTENFLITGADEEIKGWKTPWMNQGSTSSNAKSDVDGGGNAVGKCLFELKTPQLEGLRGSLSPWAETNGIAVDEVTNTKYVFSAAGDGNAYCWDLETQKVLTTFSGHSDYLHCISLICQNGLIATGSEDGTCKLWDRRAKQNCVATLELDESPGREKVVTCTAADSEGNWLSFGGQDSKGFGRFRVIHVASRSLIQTSQTERHMSCVQTLDYSEGSGGETNLVCGGDSFDIEHWDKIGKKRIAKIRSSSPSNFTLCHSPKEKTNVMVAGGTSPFIDVSTVATRTHMFSFYFDFGLR